MSVELRDRTATERADALIRRVEALIAKLAAPELDLPLPSIERLERAFQAGHRANLLRIDAVEGRARRSLGIAPRLTAHQIDTLRLYQQLGSYVGVADFRGVSVEAVAQTLFVIRSKLGVGTSREALDWLNAEASVA
jgi:hypothetical protein